MNGFNKVFMIGNLTEKPKSRILSNNMTVATLSLAVNREYKKANGEVVTETCYIDVDVWDKQAELCINYLNKGSRIHVEGRLQLDKWTSPSGEKRSKHIIKAENIQFLDKPEQKDNIKDVDVEF